MSGGRLAVDKNRPSEDAARAGGGAGSRLRKAGWPGSAPAAPTGPRARTCAATGSAWRCRTAPAAWYGAGTSTPVLIGITLAETAETPRGLPAMTNVSAPVLIGVTLAEIAEIPSPARSGDQRFAHQGFAGSSNDRNTRRFGDWCLLGALMPVRSEAVVSPTAGARPFRAACRAGS